MLKKQRNICENQNKYRAGECHKEKEKGTTAHSIASRNDGETHDPTSSSWHVQCTANEEEKYFRLGVGRPPSQRAAFRERRKEKKSHKRDSREE